MSDKYIRFRTEETAGPVVNDPRGHGHDVLIPRSEIEGVVLEIYKRERQREWEQFADNLRPCDIPETGTVSAESPDTGDQADAGEDGLVKGASESDVGPDTIPAEVVREIVDKVIYWADEMHRLVHIHGLPRELTDGFDSLVAWIADLDGAVAPSGQSPAPHGTVAAHLAEQMKDPVFRAAFEAEGEEPGKHPEPGEEVFPGSGDDYLTCQVCGTHKQRGSDHCDCERTRWSWVPGQGIAKIVL